MRRNILMRKKAKGKERKEKQTRKGVSALRSQAFQRSLASRAGVEHSGDG